MFKQRKHRTFNYQPRFSKENETDSGVDNDADSKKFITKWREARGSRPKTRSFKSVVVLIGILVLLLICMYLLDKKYM